MSPRTGLRWALLITLLAQMALMAPTLTSYAQEEAETNTNTDTEAATPAASDDVAESPGEPGPVVVMAEWRIAVVAAQRAPGINAVGLKRGQGREWLVIVADVTNWSPTPSTLDIRQFRVQFDDEPDPGGFAPRSSEKVAAALQIEPESADDGLEFAEEETKRVAVVFRIDEDLTGPILIYGNAGLPLSDAIAAEGIDLLDLPPIVPPAPLEQVLVDDVPSGDTLAVFRPDANQNRLVHLIGVDAPDGDECFARGSAAALSALAASAVFVESDPALTDNSESGSPLQRYVWIETPQGHRLLLNQIMIDDSYAAYQSDAEHTRFGAWLAETERLAREKNVGIWSACARADEQTEATPAGATPLPPTATPAPEPPTATAITPTAESTQAPPDPTATPTAPAPASATDPATVVSNASPAAAYPEQISALVATDDPNRCDRIGWGAPNDDALTDAQVDHYAACSDSGGVYAARCVESPEGIRSVAPPTDQIFLVCAVVILNASGDLLAVDPGNFTLVDGAGARYEIDPTAMDALPDDRLLGPGDIEPDRTISGAIAFAAPTDSTRPFRLEITPASASDAAEPSVILLTEDGGP